MDMISIWKNFLSSVSNKVSAISFNTWFKEATLLEIKNGIAKIIVPLDAHRSHLLTNYHDLIEETLSAVTNDAVDFELLTKKEVETKEVIINDEEKNINEFLNDDSTLPQYKYFSNFNPNYKFETFVVGESNKLAYSSALAVAENPGTLYNPLFLYGNSGLGKTHLMHSIGNYIIEHSNKKVLYLTTEQFYNDFMAFCKKNSEKKLSLSYMEMFKNKYRDVDVLMIDDIQFLSGAMKTQQEFTNTFNSLYEDKKQIIVSSDTCVKDLKLLEDRLKTRFSWGLTVNISPPDFELKVNIIKNKIKTGDLCIKLNDEIIDFIANNFGNDVRNIEGAITRLCAYAAIMAIPVLSIEDAMNALSELTNNFLYTTNSITKIQNAVASYYKLTIEDLKSKKRSKNIANARQIAMYMCRTLTEETHLKIGLEFGGRDHSTVIHSFDKVTKDLNENSALGNIINEIKQSIC